MIPFRLLGVAALALPLVLRGTLVWDTQEITLEAKSNDREIVANYPFKNAGNTPVGITDVVSSCDCTTTELTKRIYAPGEKGTLTARLAVDGRVGLQENTIAVITDDASHEAAVLRLRANILSLVELSSPLLFWRAGAEPEENSTLVIATTPLRIASLVIRGTHPAGVATARVESIMKGAQYRVFLRPASTARNSNFTVSCSATFTDGTTQDFIVYGTTRK